MNKVLMAADNDIFMHRFYDLIFLEENVEVLHAYNGKEALEAIKQKKIDLLITDLQMTTCDGFKLITSLESKQINIPTVIVSSQPREFVKKCFDGNLVENIFEKPISNAYEFKEYICTLINSKILPEKSNYLSPVEI